jgi:hypothetical protein
MNLPMSWTRLRPPLLACALLLATLPLGCSDDSSVGPEPPSGSWEDLGLSANFADVGALASWNGLLVVAAHLHRFQGEDYSGLLTWDGSAWTKLPNPFGGAVKALAVFDGDLIVGCGFNVVNGDTLPNIGAWDGSQWTMLGTELADGSVIALTTYQGNLVAAVGIFNGTTSTSYVARWDGASWHRMGGTLNGYVGTMTVYQGLLVVGGLFDTVDGVPAKGVAAWNGTAWAPVGGGIEGGLNSTGSVSALSTDGTTLYAGGDFRVAGGVPAVNVARWNGSAWDSLGAGLSHPTIMVSARGLAIFDNTIVAGGVFATEGVWRWNGSTWSAMTTLYGVVNVLTIHNGTLIAGGYFPTGTNSAYGVARWVP